MTAGEACVRSGIDVNRKFSDFSLQRRWRARCQNWDVVLSQLEIRFPERTAG